MLQPNYILLYVDSAKASGAFYGALLNRRPIEESPTFVLFALDSGLKLGLWSRDAVEPAATPVGGSEVAFRVDDNATVDAIYADWKKRSLPIAQNPTTMDFGRTFVALDPDGHRLRIFALAET